MKLKSIIKSGMVLWLFASTVPFLPAQNVRKRMNMDEGWKFHLGHAKDPAKNFNYGGHSAVDLKLSNDAILKPYGKILTTAFDDNDWGTINLPHDWAVELPFVNPPEYELYHAFHGYKPLGVAFPENSIGWYRKSFTLSPNDSLNKYVLQFDGVYRNCKVFVNGDYIGENESGYNTFQIDITNYLYFGKSNLIVVKVDASQFEGWWYEGAGIYRHVWLIQTNQIHIPVNGMYIYSVVKDDEAIIYLETGIENSSYQKSKCELEAYVIDSKGSKIAQTASKNVELIDNVVKKLQQEMIISHPHLWSIEDPYLYRVVSVIKKDGKTIDTLAIRFGIRTIVATEQGLFLNGHYLKIKGLCNHQDHAGVGTAIPDAIQYYRIKLLKEMGANAYRTSHNAATPEVLDACDELGILVLAETRQFGTSEASLKEWEDLIVRDRNHPSLFMWCMGNEENVLQRTERGRRIALSMMAKQRELDPSRTVTFGDNSAEENQKGISSVIPVRGFNYQIHSISQYKKNNSGQPIIGTEMASSLSTRGIYFPDVVNRYETDYDKKCEEWFKICAENDWFIGGFSWTGFDYRGENRWPNVISNFGVMDICGFPKNTYYYYKSWWSDEDVLHIFPHWNWKGKEGQDIKVFCYSNAEKVELFLNGESLGKKEMPRFGHLEWTVKYRPGKLKAIAYRNGHKSETSVETSDEAYKLVAAPDRTAIIADGKDAMVVNFTVKDKKGRDVPDAMNLIHFNMKGDAKIIGLGNGNPGSHEDDKCLDGNYKRALFNGECQIIVQSGKREENIIIEANGEGLQKATCIIAQKKPIKYL